MLAIVAFITLEEFQNGQMRILCRFSIEKKTAKKVGVGSKKVASKAKTEMSFS